CLTPENLDARWLNFEAGAISKIVSSSHVCPYLLELEPTDVTGPLSQFQATKMTRTETLKLVASINETVVPDFRLGREQLEKSFDMWWSTLEEKLKAIPVAPAPAPHREQHDLLQETLSIVREMAKGQQLLIRETLIPRIAPARRVANLATA